MRGLYTHPTRTKGERARVPEIRGLQCTAFGRSEGDGDGDGDESNLQTPTEFREPNEMLAIASTAAAVAASIGLSALTGARAREAIAKMNSSIELSNAGHINDVGVIQKDARDARRMAHRAVSDASTLHKDTDARGRRFNASVSAVQRERASFYAKLKALARIDEELNRRIDSISSENEGSVGDDAEQTAGGGTGKDATSKESDNRGPGWTFLGGRTFSGIATDESSGDVCGVDASASGENVFCAKRASSEWKRVDGSRDLKDISIHNKKLCGVKKTGGAESRRLYCTNDYTKKGASWYRAFAGVDNVSISGNRSCAVSGSGTLWCDMGGGNDGGFRQVSTPGERKVRRVSVGEEHKGICVTDDKNQLFCARPFENADPVWKKNGATAKRVDVNSGWKACVVNQHDTVGCKDLNRGSWTKTKVPNGGGVKDVAYSTKGKSIYVLDKNGRPIHYNLPNAWW